MEPLNHNENSTEEHIDALAERRSILAALPKIDLHRHLEGSIRLNTLLELARQFDIDLPAYDLDGLRPFVQIMPGSPASSRNFLSKFEVLRRFYATQQTIERITREVIEDAAADNIKYLELRFTPKALAKQNNFLYTDVIRWVCQAVETAQQTLAIQVRLIVSLNRHESVQDGERILSAALDYRTHGVVAVDLAGAESDHPAQPFFDMLAEARRAGLELTIHAGEWSGPGNIRDAIEILGAARIGHGVRIIEDDHITRLARSARTTLEVCLTSNVQSGVVRSIEYHPLRDLNYLGLCTTLNTDDPSVSNITLTDELVLAVDKLGLSLDDIKRIILNGARSAFLPPDERAQLVAYFSKALGLTGAAVQ